MFQSGTQWRVDVTESRNGFCIFIHSACEGTVPLWYDDNGRPVVHATEVEAQQEILDDLLERIEQFRRGERDFDDAITIEEFIAPVTQCLDGGVVNEMGCSFGRRQSFPSRVQRVRPPNPG
jgi:hypothetical protein